MIRRLAPLVAIIGLGGLAAALGGYQGALFAQFATLGAATAALALCWGFAGILSLGHAVSFGVGAYVTAWVGTNAPELVVPGVLLGGLASALVSLAVGFIGLRGRVNPVTFALLTFIVLFGAVEIASQWSDVTGGFNGIAGIPPLGIGGLWQADFVTQSVLVAVLCGLLTWLVAALARSPLGGALKLIGDSPIRAASSGFNVPALRIGVFTIAGTVAGLAGGLFATQSQFVAPDQIGVALATNFVVWAMIGSRTSIVGSFTAAVVISWVTNELSSQLLSTWLLIMGVIFLLVVLVLPDGLAVFLGRFVPARFRPPHRVPLDQLDRSVRPSGDGLRATGVTCTFGPFTAVDDVNISVAAGGVHCLIGPNGAGKSTLLNALSGTVPPVRGHWSIGDTDLSRRKPWQMARAGVLRKFQAPAVGRSMSVAENLALSVIGPTIPSWKLAITPWRAALTDASWRIVRAGALEPVLDQNAGTLSHGQRQVLELAMTFAVPPRLVLLDEPTAGMTREETDVIAALLRSEAAEPDVPIIVVEHDMALIRAAATRVTVLQAGRVLAEGSVEDIESDERVTAAYVGGPH